MRTWIGLITLCLVASAVDFPETEIANAKIRAKLYLPDALNGSYRGTRFDWGGIIYSLEYNGHQYFGKWYEKHDPKGHDSITGPVEEFSEVGFAEATPGEMFVRPGVGITWKPEDKPYERYRTYKIQDWGKRAIKQGKDSITFFHAIKGPYAYEYSKTVRLTKTGFVLEHVLHNKGDRAIKTDVYNHNFFVIDDEVVGPDVVVKFGFDPKAKADLNGLAAVQGRELHFTRELQKGEHVFTEFEGFSQNVSDYSFEIQNKKTGAGVKIHADQPISKMVFWSIRTVACPEPYIALDVQPGKTAKWTITYDLY